MAAPIPKNLWSWKYAQCIMCGTREKEGNKKHSSKGLCIACYDRKRAKEHTEQRKETYLRYKSKIRSNPELLKQYNEYQRQWRKKSPSYRAFFVKQKMMIRFYRFIKDYFEQPTKPIQRRHQGLYITYDYGNKHYRVMTPIKPLPATHIIFDGKEGDRIGSELEAFKSVLEKYLRTHS